MLKRIFKSKSHPYSRAVKLYGQLRHLDEDGQQYWFNLIDILKLCIEAIEQDKLDGDAHVLLANGYLLGAFAAIRQVNPEGYVTSLSKCAAVIYEWKTNPRLFSAEKRQGDKIYEKAVELLTNPPPVFLGIEMSSDIRHLHEGFYRKAITFKKAGD